MRTFTTLFSWILLGLCSTAAMYACGCSSETPQTRQAISQVNSQASITAAKVIAKQKIKDARAEANPILHPLTAASQTVRKLRAPLLWINLIAFISLCVSIGLLWTPLSVVSKTAVPVCATVTVLSLAGLVTLPFFPWILLAAAAGVVALVIYEIVRAKSIGGAVSNFETEFKLLSKYLGGDGNLTVSVSRGKAIVSAIATSSPASSPATASTAAAATSNTTPPSTAG